MTGVSDYAADRQRERLMSTLDEMNGRFGSFGRFTALPGTPGSKRECRMGADDRSAGQTTRISEVPMVRI